MSVAWTLEYNGQQRPLANWGIRNPRLTFRSLDVDQLTFSMPRADVLAEPVFPYDAELILRRNGVGWFRGRVATPAANGNGRTEGDTYTVNGPWLQLARLVYQQPRCINGAQQITPRVTLGQNKFGQRISVGRQIFEVVQYALSKGLPIAPGALPAFAEAWIEEASDLTCAGAILKLLRFMPNAIGWFDYSQSVPVFNVQPRELLAAVTLDALDGDRLSEFSGLAPRYDLVPAGVTIIYESTTRSDEQLGGDGRTRTTITRDIAGVTDGVGSIVAVVPLKNGEAAPVGLAAAYWSQLQTVPWEGSIFTVEEECTGTLRPGKVVNITNGRAAWSTMRATVQTVTEDIERGETMAECGAPEHLAPQDFIEQQQLARSRFEPSAFPVVQPCSLPDPNADPGDPETGVDPEATIANPDAGIDPDALDAENAAKNNPKTTDFLSFEGSVDLEGCVDGQKVCVRVKGTTMTCG